MTSAWVKAVRGPSTGSPAKYGASSETVIFSWARLYCTAAHVPAPATAKMTPATITSVPMSFPVPERLLVVLSTSAAMTPPCDVCLLSQPIMAREPL